MTEQPLHDRKCLTPDPRGPAWTVSTNPRSIIVCRPRYFALDDRNDPVWESKEIERSGLDKFLIAQGESWDVPAGTPYLPLFAERVREVSPWKFEGWYVFDSPSFFGGLPLLCGLDGGLHRPALIVLQYDRKMGIVLVHREFRPVTPKGEPIDMQAHEFVSVVRYLLGLATLEGLRREELENRWPTAAALAWIEQERRNPFYGWPMPWIQPGVEFAHPGRLFVMAKHEALQQNQMASKLEQNSLRKVYRHQGMRLNLNTEGWDHREVVLDFLLRESGTKGRPRILINSTCKTLLKGMAGGLVASPLGSRKPYIDSGVGRYFGDPFDAMLNAISPAFPLRHAARLKRLDEMQEEARMADTDRRTEGVSRRWPEREIPRAAVSSWGSLRNRYEEMPYGR